MKPDHFYLPEQNFDWTHTVYGHIQEIIPQHLYWHSHERISLQYIMLILVHVDIFLEGPVVSFTMAVVSLSLVSAAFAW